MFLTFEADASPRKGLPSNQLRISQKLGAKQVLRTQSQNEVQRVPVCNGTQLFCFCMHFHHKMSMLEVDTLLTGSHPLQKILDPPLIILQYSITILLNFKSYILRVPTNFFKHMCFHEMCLFLQNLCYVDI